MANPNAVIGLAQANFAVNLLREVSHTNESTILSPISVAIALSMVYVGAKDETAKQMNRLLANGTPELRVHEYFGQMLQSFRNGQKNYSLELANKVYVKSGFSILDSFKCSIDQHYEGLFESVDFMEKAATAKKINEFVEQATHNKIQDLIQPDQLDEFTRLILLNVIYFKGNWADKFNPKRTHNRTFHVSKGKEKQLEMMHKTAEFIYQDAKDYQVLGLPYKGEQVFMFIVLPKERFGLGQVLAKLTGKELLKLVKLRQKTEVDVFLPKFKLESTYNLEEPLKKLGIARAFSSSAQFGGITQQEPLNIDKVIQKAFIELNEEGTEAAAATFVEVKMVMSMPFEEPPPKPVFRADHPFAFFLFTSKGDQNQHESILFNGLNWG